MAINWVGLACISKLSAQAPTFSSRPSLIYQLLEAKIKTALILIYRTGSTGHWPKLLMGMCVSGLGVCKETGFGLSYFGFTALKWLLSQKVIINKLQFICHDNNSK